MIEKDRKRGATGVYQRHGRKCTGRDGCGCSWAYMIELPADADGKRRQLTKSGFRTQRDAKDARAEQVRAYRRNELPANARTLVRDYAATWLAGKIERNELRPTTVRSYSSHITDHIVPVLGALRLTDVRAADVESMLARARRQHDEREAERVARLTAVQQAKARSSRKGPGRRPGQPRPVVPARPLSAASQVRLFATVRAMLNDAVRDDLLGVNPCVKARLPRSRDRHRVEPWQPDQAARFLTDPRVTGHWLYPVLWIAIHTGMRRGELCALRWRDVDLDRARLTVRRSAAVVGHAVVVGRPKSDAGMDRVVDLDVGTVAMLRAWRAEQAAQRLRAGKAWQDADGLVFTVDDGQAIHPERLTKGFVRLARQVGMPPARLHDLRHLAASLQLAADVPLAVVAKRLGHSQISLTADLYSHLLGKAGREAAERSAGVLWGR